MTDSIAPEFSRPYRIDQIPGAGLKLDLTASPEERAALARRFGLPSITTLTAHVRLKALAGGKLFRLESQFQSDLTQTCVISLEPIPASVEDSFTVTYTQELREEGGLEIDLYMDEDDPPDLIEEGVIDVGEAIAEHLALALDPFPRHPDAVFTTVDEAPEEPKKANPFQVLVKLQKNNE